MLPRPVGALVHLGVLTVALSGMGCKRRSDPAGGQTKTDYQVYALGNGLKVFLVPDFTDTGVYVEVRYRVGSRDDPPGRAGLAHLFEHLMFRGTKHLPDGAFYRYLQDASAGMVNAGTGTEETWYHEKLPNDQLELALWLESSRMGFLLEQADFGRSLQVQREVVHNERRQRTSEVPYGLVDEKAGEALFGSVHPYGHSQIGPVAEVAAVTEADARTFFETHYAPDNALLLLAGNFDETTARRLVERYFGPLPAAGVPPRPPLPRPSVELPTTLSFAANVSAPKTFWLWRAPGRRQAGFMAALTLPMVLTDVRGALLRQSLDGEPRIATNLSSAYSPMQDAGVFRIAFEPGPGHSVEASERAVQAALETVLGGGDASVVLKRAKAAARRALIEQNSAARERGRWLLDCHSMFGRPTCLDEFIAAIEAVTVDDLRSTVREMLAPERRLTMRFRVDPGAPVAGRQEEPPVVSDSTVATKGERSPAAHGRRPAAPDAPFRHRPPGRAPWRGVRFAEVQEFTLSNGTPVLFAPDHRTPLVRLEMVFRAGTGLETVERAGQAELTAKLLSQGTSSLSRKAIEQQADDAALRFETDVTWDTASLAVSALTESLAPALDLWSDMLQSPAFDAGEVGRIKQDAIAELRHREQDARWTAERSLFAILVGGDQRLGLPAQGRPDSLAALKRDDLVAFYKQHYVPTNGLILASGDIDPSTLRRELETRLGRWTGELATVRPRPLAPPNPSTRCCRVHLADVPGRSQSSLRLGGVRGPRTDVEMSALEVALELLGGGQKRLERVLREEKGWTYGITTEMVGGRDGGVFVLGGEFATGHAADATQTIIDEIQRLRHTPVGEAELRAAVDAVQRGIQLETSAWAEVRRRARLWAFGVPNTDHQRLIRQTAAVTAADVQRVAGKYLDPARLVIVIMGDRAKEERLLRRFGNITPIRQDRNPLRE